MSVGLRRWILIEFLDRSSRRAIRKFRGCRSALTGWKAQRAAVGTALSRDARQIGGATDLELAYLKQNDALQYVDFYIGGQVQPNPFG